MYHIVWTSGCGVYVDPPASSYRTAFETVKNINRCHPYEKAHVMQMTGSEEQLIREYKKRIK